MDSWKSSATCKSFCIAIKVAYQNNVVLILPPSFVFSLEQHRWYFPKMGVPGAPSLQKAWAYYEVRIWIYSTLIVACWWNRPHSFLFGMYCSMSLYRDISLGRMRAEITTWDAPSQGNKKKQSCTNRWKLPSPIWLSLALELTCVSVCILYCTCTPASIAYSSSSYPTCLFHSPSRLSNLCADLFHVFYCRPDQYSKYILL